LKEWLLLSRVVENEWVKVGPQPPKPNRRGIQLEAAAGEANVIWPSVRSSHSATLTRNLKGKTSMLVAAGENKYAFKFISGKKYVLLMKLRCGFFFYKNHFYHRVSRIKKLNIIAITPFSSLHTWGRLASTMQS
jgi:hypothetical protein